MYVGMRRILSKTALPVAILVLAALPGAATAAGPVPAPPLELPGAGARAAAAGPATWLVGAARSPRATAIARAHGARPAGPAGAHVVPRARARALAAALRDAGLLRYAEPDRAMTRAQATAVPGATPAELALTDWRRATISAALAPPPVAPQSPLIALVDSQADPAHPEFAGARLALAGDRPIIDLHGTATASVAGAPANGTGMLGVWPGARLLNVGTGDRRGLTCAESVAGIARALRLGARVLNLSFGSPDPCFAQYEAVSIAVARGLLVVASAGNDRRTRVADGRRNPVMYPAAFPHVVSVAAYGPRGGTSSFSTANGAVDVAAPGESVVAAVPPRYDEDRTRDGYQRLDGTSFSAPIVAGAGAWLLAARPDLRADQVAGLVRRTARDIDARGWDASSGFGALDLGAALTAPAPGLDRTEVNDDVAWVNGSRYSEPDPYLWRGGGPRTIRARADGWKDPVDVYRVRVPAGRRVRVTLTPQPGTDVDLRVHTRRARTVLARRGLLGQSIRGDGRRDSVAVRLRRAATVFVSVLAPRSRTDREPGVSYRLRVSRG